MAGSGVAGDETNDTNFWELGLFVGRRTPTPIKRTSTSLSPPDYDAIACRMSITRPTSLVTHLSPSHIIQRRADPSCARLPSFTRTEGILFMSLYLFVPTSKLYLVGITISGGETESTASVAISFLFRTYPLVLPCYGHHSTQAFFCNVVYEFLTMIQFFTF